jgi:hypothetical protein
MFSAGLLAARPGSIELHLDGSNLLMIAEDADLHLSCQVQVLLQA